MIRSVHVIGLGALGLLFGDIIMDPERYQRHSRD